jgi:hypothetical protein
MDSSVEIFKSGTQNLVNNEIIPQDAAQDSLGFINQDGKLKLIGGRLLIWADSGVTGLIRGLWFGYRVDGSQVLYRKTETKLQYLLSGTWTDVLTGLTSGTEASFANYSSNAGAFTFFVTTDGYWKINNANPATAMQMYNTTDCKYVGSILIDRGRTLLWNKSFKGVATSSDPTGLYGTWIDTQVYNAVSGEATASLTGTLAFKAGHPTGNCFGVTITLTGTGEVYTDNLLGILTGTLGGTGTINYITGVFTVTNPGVGTAAYTWEDSNQKGVTDFKYSATRIAGEGFVERQDLGGDKIMNVLVGQDGNYYSLKQQSAYSLNIAADDKTFTNQIYYANMGLPSGNAAEATAKGIIFINTSNPDKPEMTLLVKNVVTSTLLPTVVFPGFKFSNYDFSDSYFSTYERYVTVSCKKMGSTQNDTILLCNISDGTVDISPYEARMFAKDNLANLYVGSPLTQNVYQIYNGFDDLGNPINNYWIGAGDQYGSLKMRMMRWRFIRETLKKFRKYKIKGTISLSQSVQVWFSFDDAPFQLVGTILGSGSYVDSGSGQLIGSNFIGQVKIGGDTITNAYPFFCQLKFKVPKFRKRTVKLVATGIGYFDVNFVSDFDIMLFENRIPARFRSKQSVSVDGTQTNL